MQQGNKLYLGKARYVKDGISISEEFMKIASDDEETAKLLCRQGRYNQSAYYFIQSMEKYIKYYISKKVDISNPFFANKVRETGHSLDLSVDFLIEIMAGNNDTMRKQISEQLKNKILRGIRFSGIYNAVRYPFYNNGTYKILEMSYEDCETIKSIYSVLKRTLSDLDRI